MHANITFQMLYSVTLYNLKTTTVVRGQFQYSQSVIIDEVLSTFQDFMASNNMILFVA